MPGLVVIAQQIKEKQMGAQCAPPAYMIPKDRSLNRVKLKFGVRGNFRLLISNLNSKT